MIFCFSMLTRHDILELLAPNRFTVTINNCDAQALCTGKKSILFNCLFYM